MPGFRYDTDETPGPGHGLSGRVGYQGFGGKGKELGTIPFGMVPGGLESRGFQV